MLRKQVQQQKEAVVRTRLNDKGMHRFANLEEVIRQRDERLFRLRLNVQKQAIRECSFSPTVGNTRKKLSIERFEGRKSVSKNNEAMSFNKVFKEVKSENEFRKDRLLKLFIRERDWKKTEENEQASSSWAKEILNDRSEIQEEQRLCKNKQVEKTSEKKFPKK